MRARWAILFAVAAGAVWLVGHHVGDPRERTPADGEAKPDVASGDGSRSGLDPRAQPAPPGLRGVTKRGAETLQSPPVTGRVVDEDTGLGIEGVRLYFARRPAVSRERDDLPIASSLPDGRFSIDGLDCGTWIVFPFHDNYTHPFLRVLLSESASDASTWRQYGDDAWGEGYKQGLVFEVPQPPLGIAPIECRMRRGSAIRGRVLGPGDTPMAGAPVRLRVPYDCPLAEMSAGVARAVRTRPLTQSDGEGRFSIGCFPGEMRSIRLGADHETLLARWSEPIDTSKTEEVVLRLCEAAVIEGSVRRSDGRPEPSAGVFASVDWRWITGNEMLESDTETVWTSWEGQFHLPRVPPDSVVVRAHAAEGREGEAALSVRDLRPGEVRTGVVLTLSDPRMIRGVLGASDGTALREEYIAAYGEGNKEEAVDGDWTDEAGRFALDVQTDAPVDLVLETGNRADCLVMNVRAPLVGLRLVSTPTPQATIKVHVVGPGDQPIPSFHLYAWPQGRDKFNYERGEDGGASIKVQGTLPYYFLVSDPRNGVGQSLPYAPFGDRIDAPPEGVIEVHLSNAAEFYGWILDTEGAPVPNVRLFVQEREIPVDEKGFFRFTVADPTAREIRDANVVLPPGYRHWTHVGTFRAGEPRFIRVKGGGLSVSGRVTLLGGGSVSLAALPVQLTWITGGGTEGEESAEVQTDEEGRFALYALPADAHVEVMVHAYSLEERGLIAVDRPAVVPAGTADVILRVRIGESISGRIEGPGLPYIDYTSLRVCTLPWRGIGIHFYPSTPPTPTARGFGLHGLPSGRYRVALVEGDGRGRLLAWADRVEAGREDLVLRVPRLDGAIEGTIDKGDLQDADGVDVAAWHQDGSDFVAQAEVSKEGRFRIDRLDPNGQYVVQARLRTGGVWRVAIKSNVTPGQAVDLAPVPGLSIQGRVVGHRRGGAVSGVVAFGRGVAQGAEFQEEDGAFECSGLASGIYELVVLGRDLLPRESLAGVAAGSEGVVIQIK